MATRRRRITAKWVLTELRALYETTPLHFMRYDNDAGQWHLDITAATHDQLRALSTLRIDRTGGVEIKFPDKLRVLETIGKHKDVRAFDPEGNDKSTKVVLHFDREDENA